MNRKIWQNDGDSAFEIQVFQRRTEYSGVTTGTPFMQSKKEIRKIRILAISGSLRLTSSNTALLRAAARLAPERVEITLSDDIGDLPHFNPDLEGMEPPSVIDFRAQLQVSDGVLISSPEYAHGVPGVLKNALDWIVGSGELVDKPVALLNASPRSKYAQASLTETITVMSGRIVAEASITVPLQGRNLDETGIIENPELSGVIQTALEVFARAIEGDRVEAAEEAGMSGTL